MAGVKPAPWVVHDSDTEGASIESLCKETETWSRGREAYGFEIDGLVFKVDDLEKRDLLGMTAHHPRWALAWKFPPEEATSVLLDVDWQLADGQYHSRCTHCAQRVGGVTVETQPCTISVKLNDWAFKSEIRFELFAAAM